MGFEAYVEKMKTRDESLAAARKTQQDASDAPTVTPTSAPTFSSDAPTWAPTKRPTTTPVCTCSNGDPATGSQCDVDGQESCVSCNGGFDKVAPLVRTGSAVPCTGTCIDNVGETNEVQYKNVPIQQFGDDTFVIGKKISGVWKMASVGKFGGVLQMRQVSSSTVTLTKSLWDSATVHNDLPFDVESVTICSKGAPRNV